MTEERDDKRRRRWLLWLLLLLLLILIGVCGVVVLSGDDGEVATETTDQVTSTVGVAPTDAMTTQPRPTTELTTTTTLPPETAITGTWIFTVSVTGVSGSVCQGEIGDVYEREVTISAPGEGLLIAGLDDLDDPGDPEWVGTFEDGQLVFEGTRAEDDGLTTARFEMTLAEDGNSLEGEETWTWDWTSRGETGTCTEGTSTVTATRVP